MMEYLAIVHIVCKHIAQIALQQALRKKDSHKMNPVCLTDFKFENPKRLFKSIQMCIYIRSINNM